MRLKLRDPMIKRMIRLASAAAVGGCIPCRRVKKRAEIRGDLARRILGTRRGPRACVARFSWGTKWGTKPHVAQPISAKPEFARTA